MENSSVIFAPVIVSRGRKFRGKAYVIEGGYTYERGYRNSGVDPHQVTDYAKLWDPVAKRCVYANADFCEDDTSILQAQIDIDREEYINTMFNETYAWCKSQKNGDETVAKQFARNILKKKFPMLVEMIDSAFPDQRDVGSEVQRTLEWAMTLKTRECYMYGKHCPGGKPLPIKKKISIALGSLERKGITKLEGFKEVWDLNLTLMGIGNTLV